MRWKVEVEEEVKDRGSRGRKQGGERDRHQSCFNIFKLSCPTEARETPYCTTL